MTISGKLAEEAEYKPHKIVTIAPVIWDVANSRYGPLRRLPTAGGLEK